MSRFVRHLSTNLSCRGCDGQDRYASTEQIPYGVLRWVHRSKKIPKEGERDVPGRTCQPMSAPRRKPNVLTKAVRCLRMGGRSERSTFHPWNPLNIGLTDAAAGVFCRSLPLGLTPPEGATPPLPNEVKQGCNSPQGQMDCKVQAHVYREHVFYLLSTGMTALLTQGRVAFGNLGFAPTQPNAHCEAPLKARTPSVRSGTTLCEVFAFSSYHLLYRQRFGQTNTLADVLRLTGHYKGPWKRNHAKVER